MYAVVDSVLRFDVDFLLVKFRVYYFEQIFELLYKLSQSVIVYLCMLHIFFMFSLKSRKY